MQSSPRPENALTLLYELSELVHSFGDISKTLDQALALMALHLGIRRGSVTLISPETGQIRTEASYGLNAKERRLGIYKQGEGITGRVVQTGTPMSVSNVSLDPRFLNRTGARDLTAEAIGFCCVPIMLNGQVVGALSVDSENRFCLCAASGNCGFSSGTCGHGVAKSDGRATSCLQTAGRLYRCLA